MPEDLSPFAVELIQRCPALINLFAEKINHMINNWNGLEPGEVEPLEPIEISHVGYTMEQCGYEK